MKPDRYYIFVPETLTTAKGGHIKMPCGRMAAQCAHVSAKLARRFPDIENMTTLVMRVKNSKELMWVYFHLSSCQIGQVLQYDNLSGADARLLQAIATVPLTKKESLLFQEFELWNK